MTTDPLDLMEQVQNGEKYLVDGDGLAWTVDTYDSDGAYLSHDYVEMTPRYTHDEISDRFVVEDAQQAIENQPTEDEYLRGFE